MLLNDSFQSLFIVSVKFVAVEKNVNHSVMLSLFFFEIPVAVNNQLVLVYIPTWQLKHKIPTLVEVFLIQEVDHYLRVQLVGQFGVAIAWNDVNKKLKNFKLHQAIQPMLPF